MLHKETHKLILSTIYRAYFQHSHCSIRSAHLGFTWFTTVPYIFDHNNHTNNKSIRRLPIIDNLLTKFGARCSLLVVASPVRHHQQQWQPTTSRRNLTIMMARGRRGDNSRSYHHAPPPSIMILILWCIVRRVVSHRPPP